MPDFVVPQPHPSAPAPHPRTLPATRPTSPPLTLPPPLIPSETAACFLPLKRLKTSNRLGAACRTPEDTKARLHAQPACCHGNIIAHRHGLFSFRFVRSVRLIDLGTCSSVSPHFSTNPLRASFVGSETGRLAVAVTAG